MKIEAYVPKQIPRIKATDRPRIDSPPKIAIASIVTRVDTDVLMVLVRVLLSARFALDLKSALGCIVLYSRIRSKITTLSLMAYPMMVRIAAINVWSTSRLNGRIPENREKKPMTMIAVCASETTPPETPCPAIESYCDISEDYEQRDEDCEYS